jgi:hypothetical protein
MIYWMPPGPPGICGKKSRFQMACEATRLPSRGASGDTASALTTTFRSARKEAPDTNTTGAMK